MKSLKSIKLNPKLLFMLVLLSLSYPFAAAESLGTGQGFVLFGIVFSIIICSIFFLVLSLITTNIPIKFFFIVMGAVCLIFNVGISIVFVQEYFSGFGNLSSITNNFYYLLLTLIGGGMVVGVVGLFIWSILKYKEHRGFSD